VVDAMDGHPIVFRDGRGDRARGDLLGGHLTPLCFCWLSK
jgi:hypothetical protein